MILPDIGILCLLVGVKDSYDSKQRILQRRTMSAEAERVQEENSFMQEESSQRRETGKLSSSSAYRITAFK